MHSSMIPANQCECLTDLLKGNLNCSHETGLPDQQMIMRIVIPMSVRCFLLPLYAREAYAQKNL